MIQTYSPKKSVFYVIFYNILGKPFGLIISALTAYYFGTGKELDAFLWSSSFLMLATGITIGSWPLVITPILADIKNQKSEQVNGYISAILSYGILFIIIVSSLIFFMANSIVRYLTNFEPETQIITVNILRSLTLYFLMNSIYEIENAIFNTYRNFKVTSSLVFYSRILVILSLALLTNTLYINSLIIGYTLASVLQFGVPLYLLLKMKNSISLKLNCDLTWIKKTLFLLAPFYVVQILNSTTEIFYRYLASGFSEGALSCLNYGNIIKDLTINTLAITLSTVMFTEFAMNYSQRNLDIFENNFKKSIFLVWYVVVPASAFMFFFSDNLIVLIFRRGAFDNESAINSYRILQVLSIGMFAWAGHYFTHRAFYSFHDTVTPLIVCIPNTFIILGLYYLFAHYFSVIGIAFANAIGAIWCFWLYLIIFRYKHMKINILKFLQKLIILMVISIICFGIFKYVFFINSNPLQETISQLIKKIIIVFIFPSLLYFSITSFLGIPEAAAMQKYFMQVIQQVTVKIRSMAY
jgi:putative peptidoglycan lipid II flippase